MATISIADNDARVQYTQAINGIDNDPSPAATELTIDFPFFALDDIKVIKTTAAGVDTTLTRGSGTGTFTVVGTSVDDGFSGGSVKLHDTSSDATIRYTIFRDITVERTTDFPTSGPFNVSALNTELDKIFAIEQELETEIGRTMKLSDSDTAASLTLPNLDTRKGKTLAFNNTTGLPEAGPSIADVQTVSSASADIATLADIQDGTTATNAITTVSGISANVTTVAGISGNVTTVAGQVTNLNNVTNNLTAIQNAAQNATDAADAKTAAETAQAAAEAALDTFDDRFLGAKSGSEPTVDNDGNALLDGALYFDTDLGLMKVYDQSGTQWVQLALTGTNQTNVNLVAGQISPTNNISTVAGAITAGSFADATTFTGIYSVGSSDPTSPTPDAGDLFYNTTSNTLKVYNGSGWVDVTLQGATISTFEYTATAGQTAFTGNDNNGNSLNYNTTNLLVTINGVIIPSSDYTTTSATTLTLDADAAAEVGDSVVIISYSEFTASVSDISTDTTPTLGGNLDVGGNSIVSTSDGDINITPNGTGKVKIDNVSIDGNTITAEDTDGDLILQPNGTGDVEINLTDSQSYLNINFDASDSAGGPGIILKRTSSSPADGDDIGRILFQGTTSTGTQATFAEISAEMDDVSASTPNGALKFNIIGDSPASGTAALELLTELGTNVDGIVRFGNEPKLVWADHKGTAHDCTLDWETPTQANTISFPNATGTLGYVALSTTTITSATASIDIDNLPDEFDTFHIHIKAHPETDTVSFQARFLDTSGNELSAASTYAFYRLTDGGDGASDNTTSMQFTGNSIGNSTNEGVVADLTLQNRNFTTSDTDEMGPSLQGNMIGGYNSSVLSGGVVYGGMNDNAAAAIRGVKFYFSSGNVARATVHVYGIQNT